jgi:hypothetical protein
VALDGKALLDEGEVVHPELVELARSCGR